MNTQSIDVNNLVDRAIGGCSVSLDKLFREQHPKLQRFIRNRVSRKEDIEDLIQDTFLWAQRGLSSFQGNSRFSTWILGIANNLIRNHYNRSPEYRYDFVTDEVLEQVLYDSSTPEAILQQEHCFKQLECSINMLPKDAQKILHWVAVENYSYQRVAQELGITISGVKSRLFRARSNLKESVGVLL